MECELALVAGSCSVQVTEGCVYATALQIDKCLASLGASVAGAISGLQKLEQDEAEEQGRPAP